MQKIVFSSKAHHDFYMEKVQQLNADDYLKALIYTVGICEDSRRNWNRFYDEKQRLINPDVIHDGWQTGTTVRLTRLAFNLFTDSEPTAVHYDEKGNSKEDFDECRLYSSSDIFCCEVAQYFVEAVKIRYPCYFSSRESYTE